MCRGCERLRDGDIYIDIEGAALTVELNGYSLALADGLWAGLLGSNIEPTAVHTLGFFTLL